MIGWCDAFDQAVACMASRNKQRIFEQDALLQPSVIEDRAALEAIISDYYSDRVVIHQMGMPDADRQAFIDNFVDIYALFHPQITRMAVLAERDLVATASLWSGVFTGGADRGLHPTGKPVAFTSIEFGRMEDGKCVEAWSGVNVASVVRQLYTPLSDDDPGPEQPWTISQEPTRLTSAEQRALLMDYLLSANQHDYALMERCWSDDGSSHWLPVGMNLNGIRDITKTWKLVGLKHRIAPELMVVDGNLAALHCSMYPDIPAAHGPVTPIGMVELYRFDTCRIAEEWVIWDHVSLQRQIDEVATADAVPA